MTAYATVQDYEAKFGALSGESEQSRVSLLLDDASMFIDALVEARGIDAAKHAAGLKALCLDYTHEVIEDDRLGGLAALTQQAGSFMETKSFRSRKKSFDVFARDYYSVLGIGGGGVMFAWPGGD